MNQHTCFKDLKAKISERGICTNSAIHQMLVAEHIQEMNKCRVEEDTADSTVLLSQPIKIMSKIRARFSQQRSVIPVPRVPSLSTASTILDDKRFLARAFQRRSEENLQKLVWLRPAETTMEQPRHHITKGVEFLSHEVASTGNKHLRSSPTSIASKLRRTASQNGNTVQRSLDRAHSVATVCTARILRADTTKKYQSSNQRRHPRSRSVGFSSHEVPSTNSKHQSPQGQSANTVAVASGSSVDAQHTKTLHVDSLEPGYRAPTPSHSGSCQGGSRNTSPASSPAPNGKANKSPKNPTDEQSLQNSRHGPRTYSPRSPRVIDSLPNTLHDSGTHSPRSRKILGNGNVPGSGSPRSPRADDLPHCSTPYHGDRPGSHTPSRSKSLTCHRDHHDSQRPADLTMDHRSIKESHDPRSRSEAFLKRSSQEERSKRNKHPPRCFPSKNSQAPAGKKVEHQSTSKQPHHVITRNADFDAEPATKTMQGDDFPPYQRQSRSDSFSNEDSSPSIAGAVVDWEGDSSDGSISTTTDSKQFLL